MAQPAAMNVAVVLPAAGSGVRAAAPTPKQFISIAGKPLLYYTLASLEAAEGVAEVVVPCPAGQVAALTAASKEWQLRKPRFVEGGTTRHRSIAAGVAAVSPDCNVVVVHDAVRPFVSEAAISAVAAAGHTHGAAGMMLPLVSTVIQVDEEGFLVESLDRSKYRGSQTPQAFRRGVIAAAYEHATAEELDHGTECLALALKYAHDECKVKLLDGDPQTLWKVTYPHDILAAEQQVKRQLRKIALVSGGSRGIGREVALALANRGYQVAVLARSRAEVESVCDVIGGLPLVADVGDSTAVRKAFERVVSELGNIDVLVCNAGQAIAASIADTTDAEWQSIVDCNLSGAFFCCREAMRTMQASGRGGVIVTIGSSGVNGGRPRQAAYGATKAGLHALTETIALEGRPHGIYAYCVAPTRTFTKLRTQIAPEESPDACLSAVNVADAVVSVVIEGNPHLSGQSFWLQHEGGSGTTQSV